MVSTSSLLNMLFTTFDGIGFSFANKQLIHALTALAPHPLAGLQQLKLLISHTFSHCDSGAEDALVTIQERLVEQTSALEALDIWRLSTPADVTALCA